MQRYIILISKNIVYIFFIIKCLETIIKVIKEGYLALIIIKPKEEEPYLEIIIRIKEEVYLVSKINRITKEVFFIIINNKESDKITLIKDY